MASIGLEIKLDSVEVTKKVVQRIIDEVEWEDWVTEEYKRGFYEFGNALLKYLDKYCEEEKSKQEEPTTVANPDTSTETDFKYFTAEQVRNMSQKEVKENYADIMKSMKKWG